MPISPDARSFARTLKRPFDISMAALLISCSGLLRRLVLKATSSMTTELAKGKTLDEAMEITRQSVADALDGLPPVKMHCSNLAADALHEAIKNYREKKEK